MRRLRFLLASLLAGLVIVACAPAAPSAPTAPTAAPKAAEPTEAAVPAPQPTAAPAAKATFATKGRAITVIVPYAAGGGTDAPARLLVPLMEKELGTPVQIVNKDGAGSQVGVTGLAAAKPDGYTIGYTLLPTTPLIYLDPERKATFTFKSFQPVALHNVDTGAITVSAESPIKTVKDLVNAAKAKPKEIKVGTDGVNGLDHMSGMLFEKLAGVQFSYVHFDSSTKANTALLGGNVDVRFTKVGSSFAMVSGQKARGIAVLDKQESKAMPGVPTLESQGYKLYWDSSRAISAPAGTPKEVVDVLAGAIKKGVEDPDHQKKLLDMGFSPRFMGPDELASYWSGVETTAKDLLAEAKKANQ